MNWESIKNADTQQLIGWAESQPWCTQMSKCLQDSLWHAEGDVWTHTKLVLQQLRQLDEWSTLSLQQQTVLRFTALLHDVAKPRTTEVDPTTGRISSPKHAVKGELMARCILRRIGCDLVTRETICRMVRYHGRPVFLLERRDPVFEIVKMSCLLNNRLLYLFALADARGRDTDTIDRPEENLHCWKLLAQDQNCFEVEYPFHTAQHRFVYLRALEPNLHYIPFESFSCTVTLLAGLPGSGKDRWISQHCADQPVVSLDNLREELDIDPTDNQGEVAQLARDRCRELLREKRDFVFNATNILRTTRNRWTQLFADYGARIVIIYLEPPLEQIFKQNRSRSANVPQSVIQQLADKCEPPTVLECHELKLIES